MNNRIHYWKRVYIQAAELYKHWCHITVCVIWLASDAYLISFWCSSSIYVVSRALWVVEWSVILQQNKYQHHSIYHHHHHHHHHCGCVIIPHWISDVCSSLNIQQIPITFSLLSWWHHQISFLFLSIYRC